MKIQNLSFRRAAACFVLVLGATLHTAPVAAQTAQSQQVLDRVFTYDTRAVLNMATGNANDAVDYTNLGLDTSPILTCALTPADGLWCLDGRRVRRWANPLATDPGVEEFKCTNENLGFDALSPLCTGMTVDKSGTIWLSGKKKLPRNWPNRPWWISEQAWIALQTWFSPYSVVKVTKKAPNSNVCPVGQPFGRNIAYCAVEAYSGKFLVTRLSSVDGDAAKNFKACSSCAVEAGVLGVEDFRNVVFFPDVVTAQPRQITGGWNASLKFGEVFDDVSFLVFEGKSIVLATTNSGRVLAKDTSQGGMATEAFNIPAKRAAGSAKCSITPSQFGIRSASTTAVVFVTDRQYCQVPALEPVTPVGSTFKLKNLQKNGSNLTLDTKFGNYEAFPIIGLTIAPGIGVDLSDCFEGLGCALVNNPGGTAPAASLLKVKLVDQTKSGATVFQLKDIPDCRYAEFFSLTPEGNARRDLCALLPGVVVNPPGNGPFQPAAQMLNATKLLSGDVINAFKTSGVTLPDLLISRQYRGQAQNDYKFGALFIIPAEGVRYKSVFESRYDVLALQGKPSVPAEQDFRCKLPPYPQLPDLLSWNVTTAVSETYRSIGGKYIDSLANIGCGSIRGSYGRLSLLPYDLEITPDTYAPVALWPFSSKVTKNNDAVFGRLVESLIDDLGYVFKELACKPGDSSQVPLPGNVCASNSAAREHLYWLEYKFDRCMVGAFTPKQLDGALPPSLRNRPYCQFTLDRLTLFQQSLPNRDTPGPDYIYANDIANRLGELHSRIDILRNVYTERFLPSIPDRGFCKELQTCGYHNQ